jgi:hypothetical protein
MINLHIPAILLIVIAAPVIVAMNSESISATAQPRVETRHSGHITGWQLDQDGRVYFRLTGRNDKQQPFNLWYVTPASQTSNTELEPLVLQAVFELQQPAGAAKPPIVVVRGDDSNDRGRSPDDALQLVSMACL